MRKRSKYRPKTQLVNPVMYVVESLTPVVKHGSFLLDLRIKNHGAMAVLTQGKATKADMDALIHSVNITEALYRMGKGTEYSQVILDGNLALRQVCERGAATGRFILTGPEMAAINLVMELHDAQLDTCIVKDIERAVALVKEEERRGNMTRIKGFHSVNTTTTAGDSHPCPQADDTAKAD